MLLSDWSSGAAACRYCDHREQNVNGLARGLCCSDDGAVKLPNGSLSCEQADRAAGDEGMWDGDGDDALVETDEEEDVVVLGDPALAAAATDPLEAQVSGCMMRLTVFCSDLFSMAGSNHAKVHDRMHLQMSRSVGCVMVYLQRPGHPKFLQTLQGRFAHKCTA